MLFTIEGVVVPSFAAVPLITAKFMMTVRVTHHGQDPLALFMGVPIKYVPLEVYCVKKTGTVSDPDFNFSLSSSL